MKPAMRRSPLVGIKARSPYQCAWGVHHCLYFFVIEIHPNSSLISVGLVVSV